MQLTVEEAAIKLGKTPRQVRYLIKQGELPARKNGKRWVLDSADLPASEAQQEARERKERHLRAAVEKGLDLPAESRQKRYSARDLRAIQLALPLHQQSTDLLGPEHQATRCLRQAIEHLTRGCHRYDYGDKAAAYQQARDAASAAVSALLFTGDERTDPILHGIEQELLGSMAGLLRRLARKQGRA